MNRLPDTAIAYMCTVIFDETSVPPGLLKEHNTKQGVWGVLTVTEGTLTYVIAGDRAYTLTPQQQGIIEPQRKHHLVLHQQVRFFLTFYRANSPEKSPNPA